MRSPNWPDSSPKRHVKVKKKGKKQNKHNNKKHKKKEKQRRNLQIHSLLTMRNLRSEPATPERAARIKIYKSRTAICGELCRFSALGGIGVYA